MSVFCDHLGTLLMYPSQPYEPFSYTTDYKPNPYPTKTYRYPTPLAPRMHHSEYPGERPCSAKFSAHVSARCTSDGSWRRIHR